ncbi:MAG: hypothetical protein QM817_30800 [Archangium sp.]
MTTLTQRHLRLGVVATPARQAAPWTPFVVASLVFTVLVGALTGALDLWTLRVLQTAVPEAHRQAHALGQLFGFLWLLTLGVSLHLAPKFFAHPEPRPELVRALAWFGIGGVVLLVIGRFGRLVPHSASLGAVGAFALLVTMTAWLHWLSQAWRQGVAPKEPLHAFITAGAAWWWLASLGVMAWTWWPAKVPLEAVWRIALFGGVASWLWGVFFRAGICTLRVQRPTLRSQWVLFGMWQLASASSVLAVVFDARALQFTAGLSMAAACALLWRNVRPFSGDGVAALGALQPRAVQAGLVFVALFGALQAWVALRALEVWSPALLDDAARHAFTLGAATLLAFGFAGRMVPGFLGTSLRWPRVYDVGVVLVACGAAGRFAELSALPVMQRLAGGSGALAALGVTALTASLLRSIRAGRALQQERAS